MDNKQYRVVFLGDLRAGFEMSQVKANLQAHVKLSNTVVASLFSGDSVVLKDNLTADKAKQYQRRFYRYGAIVKLEIITLEQGQHSQVDNSIDNTKANAASSEYPVDAPAASEEPLQSSTNNITSMDNAAASSEIIDAKESRILGFEFTGNGKEYFKVWIVNIALTILSLGIYSPWAKVRNKQYFYGNTLFEGSRFEYTAQPLAILKGRILVFTVVVLYSILTAFLLPVLAVSVYYFVFGLIILLLPWVAFKSLQFNARHSQYLLAFPLF